jgi:hypothetical protein
MDKTVDAVKSRILQLCAERLLTLGGEVVYNRRARKDAAARERPEASGERWKPCGTDADAITFRKIRADCPRRPCVMGQWSAVR